MTNAAGSHGLAATLVLVLARLRGHRAVYGALVDSTTHPGTILGVVGPLEDAASRRRFLAGGLPADPARAGWGQRQRWAFPVLALVPAPILGNAAPPVMAAPEALPKNATYRQEYVRCGKATCAPCQRGPGHGPYWYAYWREGGQLRKRYVGKTLASPRSAEGGATVMGT
jgi:hypothetical protein